MINKLNQNVQSLAIVRFNFMGESKADLIAKCGSKAYVREYQDGRMGAPVTVMDGVNMTVEFTDEAPIDVSEHLQGHRVTVRFSKEQWQVINARFHEMETRAGADVKIKLDGHVVYGDLEVNGEEVQSITLYAEEVLEIEEVKLTKVGNTTTKDDFFTKLQRDKTRDSNTANEIREQNRKNRQAEAAKSGVSTRARATA